jgi:hypothetical protein
VLSTCTTSRTDKQWLNLYDAHAQADAQHAANESQRTLEPSLPDFGERARQNPAKE